MEYASIFSALDIEVTVLEPSDTLLPFLDKQMKGLHIVGDGATELIHIGQAVLNLEGTLDYFVENTFNYPTLAEAYKIAALDVWNRLPHARAQRPTVHLAAV